MRCLPLGRGPLSVRRNGGDAWTERRLRELLPWLSASVILEMHEGHGGVYVVSWDGDYANVDSINAVTGRPDVSLDFDNTRVAKLMARHYADGTHPTTAEVLRAYNVPKPEAFAKTRMAPLKAAILRELRAMRLYPYQGWDEIRAVLGDEFTDSVFSTDREPLYPTDSEYLFFGDGGARSLLYEAMAEEIEEWMRTDAVKALKRLGKHAFEPDTDTGTGTAARENPTRRRRNPSRGRPHRG